MYRKTKIVAKHIQSILLGLAILLILSCLAVNANPLTPETSDVKYKAYPDLPIDPEGRKYHRFLHFPAPQGVSYNTRQKAVANIDNTQEKETVVLMVAEAGEEWREWCQAFLLITEAETEGGLPKQKDLFKLFDAGTYDLDVPGKTVVLRNLPFVFRELWSGESWGFKWISFDLVDLTGDGILDIWIDHAYGVAVISFQDGEFKEVFSCYVYYREQAPEYIDLDNDGSYEIKLQSSIFMIDIPGVRYLEWTNLYEWDGTTYILNNERFYAKNDEFLIGLLQQYNSALIWYGKYEPYSFYVGLVYYYRGDTSMARRHLQRVVEHAEQQVYIQAAESLLKKLPSY